MPTGFCTGSFKITSSLNCFYSDGNNNKKLTWHERPWNDRGKYRLQNEYKPATMISVTSSDGTATCNINIKNIWMCSTYVTEACSIEVDNNKVYYAESHDKPVTIDYEISSSLNKKFDQCDCKNWSVTAGDKTVYTKCSNNIFSKHTVKGSITLVPNNSTNERYTLIGMLNTNRKQTNKQQNNKNSHKIT